MTMGIMSTCISGLLPQMMCMMLRLRCKIISHGNASKFDHDNEPYVGYIINVEAGALSVDSEM